MNEVKGRKKKKDVTIEMKTSELRWKDSIGRGQAEKKGEAA